MFMRLANARSNGHMEISYSEFVAASLRSRAWSDDEVCRAAFQRLDENADGHINVLDQTMSSSTASGISSIIRDATGSSDGSISYQEFVSYVLQQPADSLPSHSESKLKRSGLNRADRLSPQEDTGCIAFLRHICSR